MKFKIGATIPVMQYGNLQPEIEVEADTFEQAQALAMPHIKQVWDTYGEKPLTAKNDGFVKITSPFGGHAWYNDATHTYKDDDGNTLLSGSVFAKRYSKAFDKSSILPKFAAKHGVDEAVVDDMWQMKAEVATTFGTAVHKALEFYGKHRSTIEATEGTFEIHPVVKQIVLDFYKERDHEKALYEVFVTDGKRVGQIDRLVKTGEKSVIIEDFKTSADLNKGQGKMLAPYSDLPDTVRNHYALQLSFYAEILEKRGITVEGIRLHHLTAFGWEIVNLDRIKLLPMG